MISIKNWLSLSICLALALPALAQGDNYPHITTLEQQILGQTHTQDDLTARLSRMEAKAFGKASTSNDLSQRTDDLEDYSQKKLHNKPFDADSDASSDSDSASSNPPTQYSSPAPDNSVNPDSSAAQDDSAPTKYPHVDSLEKSILQQTYQNDELPARLDRLEMKAFGKTSDNQALVDRTDALEGYVEKTLHKQSFAQEQKQEAASYGGVPVEAAAAGGGGGRTANFMSMAASNLLSIATSSMLPGFGGINMIPRSAVQGSQTPAPEAPPEIQDDPAIKAPTPPPAGAKMQTQVGWCEMQLFGHTFHNMHLFERLKQLNLDLNYAPGKKPMDLMDDMQGLIKAVQAKKPAKQ
ncbi:MAG: hypothetical protein SFY67_07205 [Candidatus Melainabacteria bacterium]|nr:hypothetical protein [Candidatus Melainabacteria bacterium]